MEFAIGSIGKITGIFLSQVIKAGGSKTVRLRHGPCPRPLLANFTANWVDKQKTLRWVEVAFQLQRQF
jgi:hypothetical protein